MINLSHFIQMLPKFTSSSFCAIAIKIEAPGSTTQRSSRSSNVAHVRKAYAKHLGLALCTFQKKIRQLSWLSESSDTEMIRVRAAD